MNDIETRVAKLEAILGRGNFNTGTAQQKDATFNGGFSLLNRTALPSICAIGDLAVKSGKLYVCSASNTWTLSGVYFGKVSSNAAGTPFPAGWSVAHPGPGSYTITHNLGNTKYIPVLTILAQDSLHAAIASISNNSFAVSTVTTATDSGTDADFTFMVAT